MEEVKRVITPGFISVFSLILLVMAGLHFEIVWTITQGFQNHGVFISLIYTFGFCLMPTAFVLSHREPRTRFYVLVWAGYIWMGFFFISLWVSGLYALLSLFVDQLSNQNLHILGLSFILALYSLFRGLQKPQVHIEKIQNAKLAGLRLAQITDLHVGLLAHDARWFENVIQTVNAQKPDFIFLTGDLVEGPWNSVRPMLAALGSAEASQDRIYISGNHEMIHGGLVWESFLAKNNWKVLHNQNSVYDWKGQKILIAGVPDKMIRRFDSRYKSEPDMALKTSQKVDYKILLAHEPSSVFDLKNEKPDIILAGHTHGGQIFPFGFLVRLVQPVNKGWKKIKVWGSGASAGRTSAGQDVMVYAHQGTGLWGPPMRLGTRNQIVIFEFIAPPPGAPPPAV